MACTKLIPKIFLLRKRISRNVEFWFTCMKTIIYFEKTSFWDFTVTQCITVFTPLVYFGRTVTVIWYLMKTTNKCSRATVPKKSSSVHLCVVLSFFSSRLSLSSSIFSFSLVLQFQKKSWKNLFISSNFHTKIQKPTEIIIS